MKEKKGQITLFIILGIVIIAGMGIILYISSSTNEDRTRPLQERAAEIKEPNTVTEYIQSCVEETADQGMITVGLTGGYFPQTIPIYRGLGVPVTLYYDDTGFVREPGNDDINESLRQYMGFYLDDGCLAEIDKQFTEQGWTIERPEINAENVEVTVGDTISYKVKIPIKAAKGETSLQKREFIYTQEVNMNRINEIHSIIMMEVDADPLYIPISTLLEIERDYKVEIEVIRNKEGGAVVYKIIDPQSKINQEPIVFMFATEVKE